MPGRKAWARLARGAKIGLSRDSITGHGSSQRAGTEMAAGQQYYNNGGAEPTEETVASVRAARARPIAAEGDARAEV